MVDNSFYIEFEGPLIEETGVPVEDFFNTICHLHTALEHMVVDLTGVEGRSPDWVRQQCVLHLKRTFPGSLGAELLLAPLTDSQPPLENHGQQALTRILEWVPDSSDGDAGLPKPVTDALHQIHWDLSPGVTGVTLSDPKTGCSLPIPKTEQGRRERRPTGELQAGPLFGWLNEVNWHRLTAQLHRYGGPFVSLRFAPDLHDDMLRLATKFVEVHGTGRINKDDQWSSVSVEQITPAASSGEPFDLEKFRNNPNPKIFDPEKVVRASEPFDVDEFLKIIREGRDV